MNNSITDSVYPIPRIVGGYEVSPQFKYPAMVSLQCNGVHACGGSLWDESTVISAAHCVTWPDCSWTVSIHRHNLLKSASEEGGRTYSVVKRIPHPEYDASNTLNDVSIWKLNNTSRARTNLELDDGSIGSATDTLLTASGWGRTGYNSPSSKNKLLEVKLPLFDINTCIKNYDDDGNYKVFANEMLCAGYPEGKKDTCSGDSGGPLFIIKDGKQILTGIVSWGKQCALPKLPGVYTRVSTYRKWILDNIN
ncbi:trypsin-like serine protease [Conidiobolus coronatus NRRL 28638]|uniref:Trypsin-like serine protease n=1 Tax=Conidiobolus coronatus (strain ATCC 28846 / CBS 209.66 / NRRL 28638) TaxID=796925 RepID=A0A137NWR5_CONC2|nr:trypsin-like serine protease [Conidiobolus coronatus NRRL 28638]|eukprot:KXN67074.1 trypsin-like serine protease [Conidiobolus coronatus NRRL 28638]